MSHAHKEATPTMASCNDDITLTLSTISVPTCLCFSPAFVYSVATSNVVGAVPGCEATGDTDRLHPGYRSVSSQTWQKWVKQNWVTLSYSLCFALFNDINLFQPLKLLCTVYKLQRTSYLILTPLSHASVYDRVLGQGPRVAKEWSKTILLRLLIFGSFLNSFLI